MSELERAQAWATFMNKLRELRYDDAYREELAAAYEKYLAALKKDGFSIDDRVIILTEKGAIVLFNSAIPQMIRLDEQFVRLLRRVWGGINA